MNLLAYVGVLIPLFINVVDFDFVFYKWILWLFYSIINIQIYKKTHFEYFCNIFFSVLIRPDIFLLLFI